MHQGCFIILKISTCLQNYLITPQSMFIVSLAVCGKKPRVILMFIIIISVMFVDIMLLVTSADYRVRSKVKYDMY